ncbi:hypothetical protein Tco_0778520, partial [Tanacetum coccineum]
MRLEKLINDINIIGLNMTKFQINPKFVNHLQPSWSRFVTGLQQARNLHDVSIDQLYAYLKQNESVASEVRAMRARFTDPLALISKTYNPPPPSYSSYPFDVKKHAHLIMHYSLDALPNAIARHPCDAM